MPVLARRVYDAVIGDSPQDLLSVVVSAANTHTGKLLAGRFGADLNTVAFTEESSRRAQSKSSSHPPDGCSTTLTLEVDDLRFAFALGPGTKHSERLDAVLELVKAALITGRRLALRTHAAQALAHVLDELRVGGVVVDREGRLQSSNTTAREILDEGDGLFVLNGRLAARTREQSKEIIALVQATIDDAGADSMFDRELLRIDRPSGRRPYLLSMCTFPFPAGTLFPLHPLVAVFIDDPLRARRLSSRTLEKLYKLTPAEARVARALVQGQSLRDAAREFDVTFETVRCQLKRIMSKTGTRRQADLVRLLLRGPAGLAWG